MVKVTEHSNSGFESTSNPLNVDNTASLKKQSLVGKTTSQNKVDKLTNQLSKTKLKREKSTLKHKFSVNLETPDLQKHIKLAPQLEGLPKWQQEKVIQMCTAHYVDAVHEFEKIIVEQASQHPDSKKFADELCERIYLIAKAYYEVLMEKNIDQHAVIKELKIRFGITSEFATYGDEKSAGSVGFSPLSIEQALKGGSFREKMLLCYATIWTALPKIFEDKEMVEAINKKLEGKFQLNTELIDKKREGTEKPVAKFFAQAKPLAEFRKEGRKEKPSPHIPINPKLSEVDDLTLREARVALNEYISNEEFEQMRTRSTPRGQELAEKHVQWVRGSDMFEINSESDFYKKAIALGSLPIITGPSGTADGFFNAAEYLDMEDYKNKGILALIAWMVPADHSIHEIRVAGTWHNVEYPEGPTAFDQIYPDDPMFQSVLDDELESRDLKNPSYYFSSEFQLRVARDMEFLEGGHHAKEK